MKKTVIFLITFALFANMVHAHQPRFSDDEITYIDEPETSKAYYASISDSETDTYVIESESPFKLLVNLLVPDVPNISTEGLSVLVQRGETIVFEGANDHEWKSMHEPFANDDYFEGPGFEEEVEAGTYTILVSGDETSGKYVLVTGKKELFPPSEILNTIKVLPKLKTEFFEKPLYMAYWNPVGGFLLVVLILVLTLGLAVRKFIRRSRK